MVLLICLLIYVGKTYVHYESLRSLREIAYSCHLRDARTRSGRVDSN
jgi:hypothetical protein